MTCQEFLARHSEFLDEWMEPHESVRWRSHIEACARCARYDRVMRRGLSVVRDLPDVAPSSEFLPRLQHRLFHVRDELAAGPRAFGPGAVATLGVAAALALLAWSPLLRRAAAPAETPVAQAEPGPAPEWQESVLEAWAVPMRSLVLAGAEPAQGQAAPAPAPPLLVPTPVVVEVAAAAEMPPAEPVFVPERGVDLELPPPEPVMRRTVAAPAFLRYPEPYGSARYSPLIVPSPVFRLVGTQPAAAAFVAGPRYD